MLNTNISTIQFTNQMNLMSGKNSKDKEQSNSMPAQKLFKTNSHKDEDNEIISFFHVKRNVEPVNIEKDEKVVDIKKAPSIIQFRGNVQNEAYFYSYKAKGLSQGEVNKMSEDKKIISSGTHYGEALLLYRGISERKTYMEA